MDERSIEQVLTPRTAPAPYDRLGAVGDVSPQMQCVETVAQSQYSYDAKKALSEREVAVEVEVAVDESRTGFTPTAC